MMATEEDPLIVNTSGAGSLLPPTHSLQRRRMQLNIIFLSLGFMCTASASWTSFTIVEAVVANLPNFGGKEGYISASIVYLIQIASPVFGVTCAKLLGVKWSLVFAGMQTVIYVAAFLLYPTPWTIYAVSILLGVGKSISSTLQGDVLSANASGGNSVSLSEIGLFWMIQCFSLIWGNIFSMANFYRIKVIDDRTRRTVYGALCFLAACGVCFLSLIRNVNSPELLAAQHEGDTSRSSRQNASRDNAVDQSDDEIVPAEPFPGLHASLLADQNVTPPQSTAVSRPTFMRNKRTLLLLGTAAYTGFGSVFFGTILPTSISFTLLLGIHANFLMSLTSLVFGIGDMAMGVVLYLLGDRVRRDTYILFGFTCHVVAYYLVYLTIPPGASLEPTSVSPIIGPHPSVILAAALLMGIGDAVFNTMLYVGLVESYSSSEVGLAFALANSVQCFIAAIASVYATILTLPWHLAMMIPVATWSVLTYFCTVTSRRPEYLSR